MVEMTASLAKKPATSAPLAPQLSNPAGAKSGAMILLIAPNRLSSMATALKRPGAPGAGTASSSQMRIDAARMIVPALRRKARMRSHIGSSTLR